MIRWLIARARGGVAIVYQAVVVIQTNFNCIICHYIISKIGELLVVVKNAALLLVPQLIDRTVDVVAIIWYLGHQWWVVVVKPADLGSLRSATLQDLLVLNTRFGGVGRLFARQILSFYNWSFIALLDTLDFFELQGTLLLFTLTLIYIKAPSQYQLLFFAEYGKTVKFLSRHGKKTAAHADSTLFSLIFFKCILTVTASVWARLFLLFGWENGFSNSFSEPTFSSSEASHKPAAENSTILAFLVFFLRPENSLKWREKKLLFFSYELVATACCSQQKLKWIKLEFFGLKEKMCLVLKKKKIRFGRVVARELVYCIIVLLVWRWWVFFSVLSGSLSLSESKMPNI